MKKRAVDVRRRFDKMMERITEEHIIAKLKRKEKGNGEDVKKHLLDILLDISEDESLEIKLSRDNIKAFILDLYVAGKDTCAVTIEWALSELINHPDIMEKAVGGEGQNGENTVSMDEGLGVILPRAHPMVWVPVARLDPFPSIRRACLKTVLMI
ncbi:hypothetical protein POM88_011107 [Heracleum sosnowskyi]|uniref:Cytochrome P450 n=1 Tax=Heracleum sosnowskyi TaxID=360622 RepID=A0AAD8IWD9_9APIA|nr:hypothetical protein POM88_011107 [Heracleum sosnowskyi]